MVQLGHRLVEARIEPRSERTDRGAVAGRGRVCRCAAGDRREAGFSLVELLVVGFILAVAALIGLPALQFQMMQARLTGACDQVSMSLLRARMESLKQGVPVVVGLDLGSKRLTAFLDANEDEVLTPGESVLFSVDVPESQSRIAFHLMGPDGVEGEPSDPARAIVGFTDAGGVRVAVFRSDGSIDDPGAFRFSDGRQPLANVFEVRVSPRSTARIEVRKFRHADLSGDDPELGGSWFPRGGGKWTWY